jgi:hypothetical protein
MMNAADTSAGEHHETGVYAIRLQGHLHLRWAGSFEGFSFTHERDGTTTLQGPVIDQAALHGYLRKVRDLGLPLIAVTRVNPKPAHGPEVKPSHSLRSFKKGKRR